MNVPTPDHQRPTDHGWGMRSSAPLRAGTMLSILLAPFARRFIAGTTIDQALTHAERLKRSGFSTTLDHLGESVRNILEARVAADQYLLLLSALERHQLEPNVSLKLTQMGLDCDAALCEENVRRILTAAEHVNGFVRVDMEGSDVTQATLDLVLKLKRTRATPIGAVLQAMLRRTPDDVVNLLNHEVPIRLCKGAYKESPDVAFQDMREIRQQFASLAKRLLTSGTYHGIATHDPQLISEIAQFARAHKIAPDRFEFQMLLGIRPKLQRKLIADGWRVRIYTPFGKAWLPYTWRRIRERKENALFILKGLFSR